MSPTAASHPPLTPYDIFHAFSRIPVWELQTNQQLLRGLLDALAAHKALCDEGVLYGRISPEIVFLVEAATEQDSTGFLDATHKEEDALAVQPSMLGVNDMGAGPLRGVAHDVESFYWVLLYAVLRKLIASMAGTVGRQQQRIRTAFCKMFGGASADYILDGRAVCLSALRRYRLLWKGKIARDNISLPLRALLWRWNLYLRDTNEGDSAVSTDSEDDEDSGEEDHGGPDAEGVARVFKPWHADEEPGGCGPWKAVHHRDVRRRPKHYGQTTL
ncbi:hypothetical protein VTO73DRAFT_12066 [Trametes versicolor]